MVLNCGVILAEILELFHRLNGDLVINGGNLQAFGEHFDSNYIEQTSYSLRNFNHSAKAIYDANKSTSTSTINKL